MKKFLALLLCLVMVLSLAACGSSSGNLVGSWKLTKANGETNDPQMDAFNQVLASSALGATMVCRFDKDGKGAMIMSAMGQSSESPITWKTEKDQLTLGSEDGQSAVLTYKVSGNTLTLTKDGYSLIFEKQQ